jgi:hypothetical protein
MVSVLMSGTIKSVHLSQGDLMLCDACERARFPSDMVAGVEVLRT